MLKAVKYNTVMYRGATFDLRFRFKTDGVVQDPALWANLFFTVSNHVNGTVLFAYNTVDNPTRFTIDPVEKWVTVEIPQTDTNLSNDSLYYEVDIQPTTKRYRRILGTIFLKKDGSL